MAENNNEKKIELEENEIMRISVRDYNPETGSYSIAFAADGEAGVMVQAILNVLEKHFDMKCIPGMPMMGITICIPHYDEEDEEGEENEDSEEESKE